MNIEFKTTDIVQLGGGCIFPKGLTHFGYDRAIDMIIIKQLVESMGFKTFEVYETTFGVYELGFDEDKPQCFLPSKANRRRRPARVRA